MSSTLDKSDIAKKIEKVSSLAELEELRVHYIGKKGLLTSEMKSLSSLSIEEKKEKGQKLNLIKTFFEIELLKKKDSIANSIINELVKKEKIDTTLPARNYQSGKIHPISQSLYKIIDIFSSMGFSVESGPDIESDFNNFTALNIPSHHPAREMQDTFYIDSSLEEGEKVLRTHTSPVQVRTMLDTTPPIRIIVPGRTYRSDSDATHTPMFHQVEGLLIDENSTMAHLKGCLVDFLKEFFEISDLKYRFRPSYFPFTEPSAEMDVAFTRNNNVIKIGEGEQWLEILGCGMVNPRRFRKLQYRFKKISRICIWYGHRTFIYA